MIVNEISLIIQNIKLKEEKHHDFRLSDLELFYFFILFNNLSYCLANYVLEFFILFKKMPRKSCGLALMVFYYLLQEFHEELVRKKKE